MRSRFLLCLIAASFAFAIVSEGSQGSSQGQLQEILSRSQTASQGRSAIAPPLGRDGKPDFKSLRPTPPSCGPRSLWPVAIGVFPPLQAAGEDCDVAGLRLGLPWIRNQNFYGLDLSGFVSEANGDFYGLAVAGLVNHVAADSTGFQIAGVANHVTGDVMGLQGAAILNITRDIDGLQVALVNIADGSANACQAGFWNDAASLAGVQIGCGNYAVSATGCQIGVINVADEMNGVQIGLWNDAGHMRGVQIGLGNRIGDSPVQFLPIVNAFF